jgi:hypothetical protein
MDTVSIVNGNVCGRFRDVLARKVRFLQVHNNALCTSTWNTEDTASLYLFRPPESKTLRPVLV